ncbi:MAG: sugar phosphate isomerase/epimerase family protein [Candidatus Brocadiia bacterium]
MKLAFIAVNDLEGIAEDAAFAAQHGFQGLEFNYWGNFQDLTADTVAQMRTVLDEHGVACSSLGLWGWNHLAPDPAERQEAQGHLGRAIDFAATLGASVVVTGGGQMPDASPQATADEFARVFPPFLQRVRDAGMEMAMYPVHGNSFFQGIADYERVWNRGIDVGIKLDCANIRHAGQDYLPILRDHGDRVAYVHIKEHLYLDDELASQPAAGMGDIEWGKIMAFLYEAGYQGYLSFEPHGPKWSRPPLRRAMLVLSQRYIRQFLL